MREVRLWEGFLDSIMALAEPQGGRWTGLALPYHLHGGWYEASPWRVPDLGAALKQWREIDTTKLSERALAAHRAVQLLLCDAEERGGEVAISYE
jgi:hypothetical protein